MIKLFGRAFIDDEIHDDVLVTLDGAQIADVRVVARAPADAQRTRGVITPGFVDVHVHGGDGSDFMDADDLAAARVLAFHLTEGTTALAATTLSASRADLHAAVEVLARLTRGKGGGGALPARGAEICGIHLEGPYINVHAAGAQDRACIRPSDLHELSALISLAGDTRWIVTLAPELEHAQELIEHFRDRVLFSIGHTSATHAEAVAALEWGAAHFTHLFNAMTGMHHREPGVVGAALTSVGATAELIADGIHVHPAVLRVAAQAMPHRIALITDAIRACGMPDGSYKLYDYEITVADGAARLPGGALAGSTLTMRRAVQNMVELAGLPLETVLPMATEVPARILGVSDRKGRLEAGYDADVLVLTEKFELEGVFARGGRIGAQGEHA
jgi:N-acetylglucosamine-6-phosphate deacetylase